MITGSATPWRVWRLGEHPEMAEEAAAWFSAKWSIPEKAYRESMRESARADGAVPQWYVVRADNESEGAIIAGCGICLITPAPPQPPWAASACT